MVLPSKASSGVSTEVGMPLAWGSPCSCPGQKVPLGCRAGAAGLLTPAQPWRSRWSPGGSRISFCAGLITPSSPQSLQPAPPFAPVSSHLLLFSFPVHKCADGRKWGEQTFNSSNFLQEKSALCLIWAAPWALCLHL